MSTTNVTMRIDENLKAQLQELVSNLEGYMKGTNHENKTCYIM